MSSDWYLMTSSNLGGFEEGNFMGDRGGFKELIDSFRGKAIDIYGDKPTNTPAHVRAIVQNVTADTPANADQRQLLCEIGNLQCGQYIKFDNKWWLVVSLVDNNMVYEKAVVWYCNYRLKFRFPGGTAVNEYPIVLNNATQYNTGVEFGKMLDIGSTQRLIFVPYSADTIKVDHDYRFLIDRNIANPTAYKVTQVDTEQYDFDGHGVVRWTITEDQLRDKDDVANMVADNTTSTVAADDETGGGWLDASSV